MRKSFVSVLSGFIAFGLVSCKEEGVTRDQYEELEYEMEHLQEEMAKAQKDLEYLEEAEAKLEENATQIEELEKGLKEKEVIEEKAKQLEEDLRKVREEFDEYQKKYEVKVRRAGVGEKVASIMVDGQVLKDVEIKEVGESEVKVTHSAGFATLNAGNAPADWKERFFLRTPEEIKERAAAFAASLNPVDAKGNEGEEEIPQDASEYELRRIAQEKQNEEMKTLASKVEPALVLVEGNVSQASGFFARDGITTYLYTTAEALGKNQTLMITDKTGNQWKDFGEVEVAKGYNLARMPVKVEVPSALTIREENGETIENGTLVSSFGMASGDSKLDGRLQAGGADVLEVSMGLTHVNTGGPVVLTDGRVIGIVSQEIMARKDIWAGQDPRHSQQVSRFAIPLNREHTWVKTPLKSFLAAQSVIERFDRVTKLIITLALLKPETKGLDLTQSVGKDTTAMEVLRDNQEFKTVQDLVTFNKGLEDSKSILSQRDLNKKFGTYYRSIYNLAQKEQLQPAQMSPFHEQAAKDSMKWRAEALAELEQTIEALH